MPEHPLYHVDIVTLPEGPGRKEPPDRMGGYMISPLPVLVIYEPLDTGTDRRLMDTVPCLVIGQVKEPVVR